MTLAFFIAGFACGFGVGILLLLALYTPKGPE